MKKKDPPRTQTTSIRVTWRGSVVVWCRRHQRRSTRRHQRRSTRHPPHEQLLVGLEAGGVSYWACVVLVSALASSFSHRGGVLGLLLIVVGPWCSFIVVIDAHAGHHQ